MRLLPTLVGIAAWGLMFAVEVRAASAQEVARAQRLADEGTPAAQVALGIMHETGDGVPLNATEASKWYRKAAEQGDAEGAFRLGWLYARGEGLPQNLEQAAHWYQIAAEKNHAEAQLSLGWLHFNGEGGMTRDVAEAVRWFKLAATQGDANAQYTLGLLYSGAYADVPEDRPEAARWFERAAAQGLPPAQLKLGVMLATGDGIPGDDEQAYLWLSRAEARLPEGAFKSEARLNRTTVSERLSASRRAALDQQIATAKP